MKQMNQSNAKLIQPSRLPIQILTLRLSKVTLSVLLAGVLSQPVFADTFYRVKAGDTLQSIANQYNTTINSLININNLADKNDIKIGDKIYLTDANALSYRGKTTNYIVQNGDTLSSIARRFNTKVSTIAELNNMGEDFNSLFVGNTIIVPMPSAALVTETARTTTPVATKPTGVTKLANSTLPITTGTVVKSKPITFAYQVKSGETLFGIANKFKVDKTDLMGLNGLDHTSKLAVGQTLQIPNSANRSNALAVDKSKTTPTTTTQPAKKSADLVDFANYKVKAGDSLSTLAAKYDTTVAGLAKINNLPTTASLSIGQTILVPIH